MSYNQDLLQETALEIDEFYRKIRKSHHLSQLRKKCPLNQLWGEQNMATLSEIINSSCDPVQKIYKVHETFMFSVNSPDVILKEKIVDWYLDYFEKQKILLFELNSRFQESVYSNEENMVVRGKKRVTPDFLRTVVLALEIQNTCNFNSQSRIKVIELGAGYGGLARTFKMFNPNCTYTIIDIPESLYFSATFLRLNFPECKFLYVTDQQCSNYGNEDFDFIFVPDFLAEDLRGNSYDLFCNTASLGEMNNSAIRYWMKFIQSEITVKFFFGLNRYLNTYSENTSWRKEENICSVSLDQHWKVLKWEVEPTFTRCPYVETEVTRNLEIIALREVSLLSEKTLISRSRELLEEVILEDWYVYYYADNTLKLRDNILAPVLDMTGTLFKLWESIRLNPDYSNVSLMLKYLSTLVRDKLFEEVFYYQSLLSSLDNSDSIENSLVIQHPQDFPPQYLSELDGFNFVRWRRKYIAVPQALGEIEISQAFIDETSGIEIGDTITELTIKVQEKSLQDLRYRNQNLITQLEKQKESIETASRPPILLESLHEYNLVIWRSCFYGIPKSLGKIDLDQINLDNYSSVLADISMARLKDRIHILHDNSN